MTQSPNHNSWSFSLCRMAGYGLLAIAFFNLVDTFVPAYFRDPNWQFNTVGTLIERTAVVLVGLVLVFLGGADSRSRWERFLIKILSWSTLIVGILFLLLVPLMIKAAMAIDAQNTIQINAQYNQQITQLEQVQSQLNTATEDQVDSLLEALKRQQTSTTVSTREDLKRQIATEVEQARKTALENSKSNQATQRLNLRKSVVKWSLSALVFAFLFFSIWRMTRWTRQSIRVRSIAQARG